MRAPTERAARPWTPGCASDPDSVADADGRVHGIDGLYVADASLMPAVIAGNTNMPTAVIGERIARSLLGEAQSVADCDASGPLMAESGGGGQPTRPGP